MAKKKAKGSKPVKFSAKVEAMQPAMAHMNVGQEFEHGHRKLSGSLMSDLQGEQSEMKNVYGENSMDKKSGQDETEVSSQTGMPVGPRQMAKKHRGY